MREKIKPLLERRSIRNYEERQIPEEELGAILEAGTCAPSGMNDHKWRFIVFKRGGALDTIINSMNSDHFYGAPTLVAVFVDKDSRTPVQDGSLAIGNMMIAAHILGLGSCWINSVSHFFETEDGKALKEKYQIPSDYICIGSCTLGYTKGESPSPKPRPNTKIIMAD